MKTGVLLFAIMILLLPQLGFCALPDELTASVMNDIHRRDENKLADVSYSLTETTKGCTTLYHVTLGKDGKERRELVAMNGKPASSDDITKYAKKRDTRGKSDGDNCISVEKLSDMIKAGTLKLASFDDKCARFDFIYDMKSAKGKSQKLNGSLVYDRIGDFVREIHIANDKPFKPDSTVKVSIFAMDMLFQRNAALNEIVYASVNMHIKGTALLVVPFDEESSMHFSNFSRTD